MIDPTKVRLDPWIEEWFNEEGIRVCRYDDEYLAVYKPSSYRGARDHITCLLHHVVGGYPLYNYVTDHIDRDRLNNTAENLRIVSHSVNMQNSAPCDRELPMYVYKSKQGRFEAHPNRRYIGTFRTVEEAVAAMEEYNDTLRVA